MSEVKKTDHSTVVLAYIKIQVLTVVDKYLGTKLDDALLRVLKRHTTDLIRKYFVLSGPESIKNQESKKSPKEIIRIKREQGEKKQESTYTIRSTDKVTLEERLITLLLLWLLLNPKFLQLLIKSKKSPKEIIRIKREQGEKKLEPMYTIKSTDKATLEEFDLKGGLFNIMHKNKSANRNPTNYRLYHALMEALIEDENAMDKEVADKVKDHKRKRDSDDDEDDDDEGPSPGSNQGESTKRRRHDSSASGSAQPPSKDSEQSTKNKLDSDASAAQQPPAHTSSAWKITDTRDAPSGSLMPRSEPQSEQSSDDIQIQYEEQDSNSDDNDNAHVPKVQSTTSWFSPIPEEDRPETPEPEWTIPSNDYPEPETN
ncbi:hypothetical protein Tco_1158369 [Tanacetum coccineum]